MISLQAGYRTAFEKHLQEAKTQATQKFRDGLYAEIDKLILSREPTADLSLEADALVTEETAKFLSHLAEWEKVEREKFESRIEECKQVHVQQPAIIPRPVQPRKPALNRFRSSPAVEGDNELVRQALFDQLRSRSRVAEPVPSRQFPSRFHRSQNVSSNILSSTRKNNNIGFHSQISNYMLSGLGIKSQKRQRKR